MIPATGKQVFCHFHCTLLVPTKATRAREGKGSVGRAAQRGFSLASASGHCSYSQACPALCSALGVFSTNRGKEEREEEITSFLVKIAESPGGGAGGRDTQRV